MTDVLQRLKVLSDEHANVVGGRLVVRCLLSTLVFIAGCSATALWEGCR